MDTEAITEELEDCAKLKKEIECLQSVKKVTKMIKFFDIQKNVNKTIKDGLKNLLSFLEDAKKKHTEADIDF